MGYGLGKANEVVDAISKGAEDAKRTLIKVPVLKSTIPHEQSAKYGGARVFLKPAANGTRVIAGGAYACRVGIRGYQRRIGQVQRFLPTPQRG